MTNDELLYKSKHRYEDVDEEYELIEVCGREALYVDWCIPQIAGAYVYYIRGGDEEYFCTIEPKVTVNLSGSVIMKEPLDFGEKGYIEFDDDTAPNFADGEMMTIREFLNRN